MASLGNMKLKIAIDSSEVNAFMRVLCLETGCLHHGLKDKGNDPGMYCNRKHIRIGEHGICKDYQPKEGV